MADSTTKSLDVSGQPSGQDDSGQPSVLPPWPFGLPLLRAVRDDPLGTMDAWHAACGDVAHLKVLTTHVYYLFHPGMMRGVLVDHHADFVKDQRILDIFQSVHGANVIATDGGVWERQRRILTPAFSRGRIEGCAHLMAAAADDAVRIDLPAATGESAVVDVDAFTTRITMDVILRALFSYRGDRAEGTAVSRAMRGVSAQVMREFFWPVRPIEWLPYPGRAEKRRNMRVIRGLIESQIKARRKAMVAGAEPSGDVLDLLFAARDDAAPTGQATLTDQEIHDNCIGLFGAGHDTSATALTWWIGFMALYPAIAERVRAEVGALPVDQLARCDQRTQLPFLQATLKEALRLRPPSTATFSRRALREVSIDNLTIPRNAVVVFPIWSMHRDERWFPEPEAFRPERFMPDASAIPRGAFMPFGAGPHFCLGQQFAMVEMTLIAATLIRHYDLALAEGGELPTPVMDLVLKPTSPLRVRFSRH